MLLLSRHYNDIAILEDVVKDNIDEGKSIHYFKWLAKHLPDPKPQFGAYAPLALNQAKVDYLRPTKITYLLSCCGTLSHVASQS